MSKEMPSPSRCSAAHVPGQLPTELHRASETQRPSKDTVNGFSSFIPPVLNVYVDFSESYLPKKPACVVAFLALNKPFGHLSVVVGIAQE